MGIEHDITGGAITIINLQHNNHQSRVTKKGNGLFKLLLRAELICVAALLLSAILGTRWQPRVALPAYGLVTIVSLGQQRQRRVVHTSSKTEYQVKG